jgi:ribonuclease J
MTSLSTSLESLHTVEQNTPFSIGNLKVRRFDVDHSVPGASAYLIQAGDKVIAYTGDLRFHGSNREASENYLRECTKANVDILLCEGTRLGPPTTDDEKQTESHALRAEAEVEQKCRDILSHENGLVIYDASPADMNRIKIVCKVAREFGRIPVFDSRKAYFLLYMNQPVEMCPGLPKADEIKIALSRSKVREGKKEELGLPDDLYADNVKQKKERAGFNPALNLLHIALHSHALTQRHTQLQYAEVAICQRGIFAKLRRQS